MKKVIPIILVIVSVFTLVSCSGKNTSSTESVDTFSSTVNNETEKIDNESSDVSTIESTVNESFGNFQQSSKQETVKPSEPNTKVDTKNSSDKTDNSATIQQKINEENIRHEQKISELQNKKQSSAKYYDDLIEKLGGISWMYVSIDYSRESELSRKIFDLEMSINELKKDTSQRALQKRTEKEKELAAAQSEIQEIREKAAKKDEIIRLYTEKNTEISKVDKQITEENELHSQNLNKLKG